MVKKLLRSVLAMGLVLGLVGAFASPAQAAPAWDTSGSWVIAFDYLGTPYSHDMTLAQDGAGNLTGNGGYPAGGPHVYTWVLTSGTVNTNVIDFYANYTASADAVTPQTTMHVVGTIAGDGTMSGTWTDNYQGGARGGTWTSTSGTATAINNATVSGYKFHDVNGNGVWNAGEPGLSGWTFNLSGPTSGSQVTGLGGAYTFSNLAAGMYSMSETMMPGWARTTALPSFTLAAGENKTNVNIGNACFVSTGGKGKGYWTNKNGEAVINDGGSAAPEMSLLSGMNLRNANGTDFNPATYASYKTWNSGATATNMANMLSAQLSALVLSREAGLVDGTKQIVITDPALASVPGMSPLGIITINDLITAANTELGLHGNTTSPSAYRAYQEALKNAVERAADGNIQLCQPFSALRTFAASNSQYYNGPTSAAPLYGDGAVSFTWDPGTGNVTSGYYNEVVPATTGTTYYNNVVSGTVSGTNVNLTFLRTTPNAYGPFYFTGTLVGNTLSGQLDGPYLFTATGTVTP